MAAAVKAEDVENCLTRILTSPTFSGSNNLQKFLSYVVREWLAGRGDEIKAYTIGVDALGKPEDFDSQTDATVRVMARRVRDQLALYYADEGRDDPVVIRIPVGSYRPEISYRDGDNKAQPSGIELGIQAQHGDQLSAAPAESSKTEVIEGKAPSSGFLRKTVFALAGVVLLAVMGEVIWQFFSKEPQSDMAAKSITIAVENLSDTLTANGAVSFSLDLAGALARNKSFAVSQFRARDGSEASTDGDLDFLIRAGISPAAGQFRGSVTLVNAHTNRLVWSRNFQLPKPSEDQKRYDETLLQINRELTTQVFGASIEALEGRDPQTLTANQLFVLATWIPGPAKSTLAWEAERVKLARLALTKDPKHGPAYSVLADKLSYLAAVDGPSDTRAAAREARRSALQAIELSPGDVNVTFNVAQHYWHSGDVRAAIGWMERTLEIDPSHALGRFFRIVLPYTCAPAPNDVVAKAVAYDQSLTKDNPIRWVTQTWLGWLHLNRGELSLALQDEERAASIFQIPYTIMRRAAVLNAMGRTREASDLIKSQRSNWPNLSPRFFADVTMPRLCQNIDGGAEMLGYYRALANETEPLLR
ncbi:MAG: hypothetical protein AAF903_14715 [Pseudomonadota bacterium]